MRRLHASATTSPLLRRPVPAWRWAGLADWSPAMASATFLFGVPVVPPGRPATPSPQRADGTAVFSLRMAVMAVLLFSCRRSWSPSPTRSRSGGSGWLRGPLDK